MQIARFLPIAVLSLFVAVTAPGRAVADLRSEIDAKIAAIKTEYNVQIHYRYNAEKYFPRHWRKAPIDASGNQIELKEVVRLLPIADRFLSSYPSTVLADNLTDIYLLADLRFYGKSYGATYNRSKIHISNRGKRKGFSDSFLLQRMHSEFSSILMKNHEFPTKEWQSANAKDFAYRGSGREMLGESNLYGQSHKLLSQGFIVKYAQSSVENDFNMIACRLLTDAEGLQRLASSYPRLRVKVDLAIRFYKSIHAQFDFRSKGKQGGHAPQPSTTKGLIPES